MAIKKRSTGGRASANRVKAVARPRPSSRRAKATTKVTLKKKVAARAVTKAKPVVKSRTVTKAKPVVKSRTVTKAKPVAKSKTVIKAKPVVKARPVTKAKRPTSARAGSPKRPAGKPVHDAGAEHPEVVALKAKVQRERSGFERRLTEAVREIGLLRHHEIRATQLERQLAERDATIGRLQAQLAERDATIGRLQTQLAEVERGPAETVYVREVQQTLALVQPTHEIEGAAPDLDEFEDEGFIDDGDLVADDE